MAHAYPMMLDLTGRLVVIVGGGAVAVRKANGVIEAGATRVRVVAPTIAAEMTVGIERVAEHYDSRHLDGAGLVFAATNSPEVNERVVRDARERGILVGRADAGEAGDGSSDFATPAKFQAGDVVVTVSAGGNPALAVAIRNDLARRIDPRHLKMAHAMRALRQLIRDSELPPERRAAIFRDLAGEEAVDLVGTGGEDALRDWMRRKYPDLKL